MTTILTYLDNRKKFIGYVQIYEPRLTNSTGYPELEGDETRRMIWLTEVDLSTTHKLRQVLNNSKADYAEVLPQFEIPVIASVLRLYLLELPGSSFSRWLDIGSY